MRSSAHETSRHCGTRRARTLSMSRHTCANEKLKAWVREVAQLTKPDRIYWCDGSQAEYDRLCNEMVDAGTLIRLNQEKRPNSFLARSDPDDVARMEDRTFVCSKNKDDAGPNNNWMAPDEMKATLEQAVRRLHARAHHVRDSVQHGAARLAYLAHRRRADRFAVRGGQHAHHDAHRPQGARRAGHRRIFRAVRAFGRHAAGAGPEGRRVAEQQGTKSGSCISPRKSRSGRSAAATAATRCSARNASRCASRRSWRREQGWLAEHMLILGIQPPDGKKALHRGGVPERLRQDQSGHADSAGGAEGLEGHDHRRGHRLDQARQRTAGSTRSTRKRAPSASRPAPRMKPTPTAWRRCKSNIIFTNVAHDAGRRRVVGRHDQERRPKTDRLAGQGVDAGLRPQGGASECALHRAAVADSRRSIRTGKTRTACRSALSCSAAAAATTVPLVTEAKRLGRTASIWPRPWLRKPPRRSIGKVGVVRRDPFAMLPFCGYHFGDYFKHWLEGRRQAGQEPPRIFGVNWFRRDENGKFLWPGFGENMRVLKWIDRALRRQGAARPKRRSATCRATKTSNGRGSPA